MKHYCIFPILLLASLYSTAQPGQINIDRIEQMPSLPSDFFIRDWRKVARDYDYLIFDTTRQGQYLPFSRLGMMGQYNYPDNQPIFLDTYVGSSLHHQQAEAINLIPAVVGASLVGIDKSNQNGINYVAALKDFFNQKNGQNVYLNNYFASSGSDWWYDLMPNVYFYQLKWLYPYGASDFEYQYSQVAERWLGCVYALGGSTKPWQIPNMNYRAFNLITGKPLTTGVPEPEASGAIAWLLLQAYFTTNLEKYRQGAELAMEFLDGLTSNPSYELQLSYGVMAAASMNAIVGTNYDLTKMLNWCFDRGNLRGWGANVGKWGEAEVNGLIGEVNGDEGYAFVMNGFQQAAALAPIPKYDKRYARALAKWLTNLASSSRYFYWNALPSDYQDNYSWASQYDTSACIPYEALKSTWQGKSPFARGDAIAGGWAATNLSLYSGSSVGYLGAIIKRTSVDEILAFDLNQTDFLVKDSLPAFLFYNPCDTAREFSFDLPSGSWKAYESLTEFFFTDVIFGSLTLSIPAHEARLVRLYPASENCTLVGNHLVCNNKILDYQYHYNFSKKLRIKALESEVNPVEKNSAFRVWAQADQIPEGSIPTYIWNFNGTQFTTLADSIELTAPSQTGTYLLTLEVQAGNQSDQDTLRIEVVEWIPKPPVIDSISVSKLYCNPLEKISLKMWTDTIGSGPCYFSWMSSAGQITFSENIAEFVAPSSEQIVIITGKVSNFWGLSSTKSIEILVRDTLHLSAQPLIWYPFDTSDSNAVANSFHATSIGTLKASDARNIANKAKRFISSSDLIYTENESELNFPFPLTVSCWIYPEKIFQEHYIFSHGSYQERFKLSLLPDHHLRFTVNTSAGITDLDSKTIIPLNQYIHVTGIYTGFSLEIYINGSLDNFMSCNGNLNSSTHPITLGRMNEIETMYSFWGRIDEFKLWKDALTLSEVKNLPSIWYSSFNAQKLHVYPTLLRKEESIRISGIEAGSEVELYSVFGQVVGIDFQINPGETSTIRLPASIRSGMYLLRCSQPSQGTEVVKIVIY